MKIYIIEWRPKTSALQSYEVTWEVLPIAYASLDAALSSVEQRCSYIGARSRFWQEHNAHGRTWTDNDHNYVVSELELRNE